MLLPKYMFLTRGVGVHVEKLRSFEQALRAARIASFNLVQVSSIIPPGCQQIPRASGLRMLVEGQIVFVVMSEIASNEPHRLLSAAIGVAIPKDPTKYGYLSEHHGFGMIADKTVDYVEDLAACMLAESLGIDYNTQVNYDERQELWKMNKEIVRTTHVVQTAVCNKDGQWTTAIAAAVFIVP